MPISSRSVISVLCSGLLILTGCLGSHQPAVRYYVLSASGPDRAPCIQAPHFEGGLGIAAIEMPGYLKNDSLMFRISPTQVLYDDYGQWAQPLDRALAETLALNIGRITHQSPPQLGPWRGGNGHGTVLKVWIDDASFRTDSNDVRLQARYCLEHEGKLLREGAFDEQQFVGSHDCGCYVEALSQLWYRFSRFVLEDKGCSQPSCVQPSQHQIHCAGSDARIVDEFVRAP